MDGDRTILAKIQRIRAGGAPRVFDLFAGCGGLSLGFEAAGGHPIAAVENDPDAVRSYAENSHGGDPRHSQPRDITATSPNAVASELGLVPADRACDIVIGGPPCQAFARVGRAKLREIADHPSAFRRDSRSLLYLQYLEYVSVLKPIALLMENVPDILNFGGHNIAEEMCDVLTDLGYSCGYTMLNSVYYGVPQMRDRVFLIGYSRELMTAVQFPETTHWAELPRGYNGSRQVAMQGVGLFTPHFLESPKASVNLRPAITAAQALCDLPPFTLHLEGKLKRGARRFTEAVTYRRDTAPTNYGRLMREWPNHESDGQIWDHVIRFLPRDYPIFRIMRQGDQYPEAYQHALSLFEEKRRAIERTGAELDTKGEGYKRLWQSTVPPYDPGKFPNKWRKLEADRPSRTLMAHLGKDGYSHIHYDSEQARTISVREAARLQSFPDCFRFSGTMNPAFRQIGNAVPPLLAKELADKMFATLRGTDGPKAGRETADSVGPELVRPTLPGVGEGGAITETESN